jgi:hypothetical protein
MQCSPCSSFRLQLSGHSVQRSRPWSASARLRCHAILPRMLSRQEILLAPHTILLLPRLLQKVLLQLLVSMSRQMMQFFSPMLQFAPMQQLLFPPHRLLHQLVL